MIISFCRQDSQISSFIGKRPSFIKEIHTISCLFFFRFQVFSSKLSSRMSLINFTKDLIHKKPGFTDIKKVLSFLLKFHSSVLWIMDWSRPFNTAYIARGLISVYCISYTLLDLSHVSLSSVPQAYASETCNTDSGTWLLIPITQVSCHVMPVQRWPTRQKP